MAQNIQMSNPFSEMTKNEPDRITDVINMCIYLIKYEANMTTEDILSEVNKELNTRGSRRDVHQQNGVKLRTGWSEMTRELLN